MTKQLRRLMVGALALVVVAACDDGIDPIATATVQVTAYVDADGSNDFDASADDPIEGATITLTMSGSEETLSETTGSDGVATFDAVEIGTYSVSIELPAEMTGVELASAENPSVTVEEDGTGTASFRYTYVPGSITGHAFVGSGDFAEGAAVVPGLTVTATDGAEGWTAETDASGAYEIQGLLPGDYTVTIDVPEFLSGTGTETVTVSADEDATADFGFDIVVTHTIEEARAAEADQVVSVVGTAIAGTTGEGSLSGSTFNIQNGAGITVYQDDLGHSVELGDSVLIYGVRGAFRSDEQIEAENVLVLGDGTLPDPQVATVAELNAGAYQGQLVTVEQVVVDSMGYSSGSGSEMWVSDAITGEDFLIYVDVDSEIDLETTLEPGNAYNVTGVQVAFDDLFEVKPRFEADIEEVTLSQTTVADVRAADEGAEVTVTAVVTSGTVDPGSLAATSFYMQDATAGIAVYLGDLTGEYAIGDVVEVTGTLGSYQDHLQLNASAITAVGTAPAPTPRPVTPTEVKAGSFQGELGILRDVEVESIDGSNVFVMDEAGEDTLQIFLGSTDGITGTDLVVGEMYNITGIITTYWGPTYQVLPRMAEDVDGETGGTQPEVLTVAEARVAAMGTLVQVDGVVTVDGANFGGTSYIQDAEAGISMYWAGDAVEGEQVTLIGTIDEFQGNLQIALTEDVIVNGTGTVPDPVVITGTQLDAGEHPAELATLESFTVTEVEVTNSFDTHIVTGTAGDGTEVQLYVDNRTGFASTDWTVDSEYEVTGIVAYRTDGWFLLPRKPADQTAK